MSQKPITMDHLKQILQLKRDGVAIKEIVRRTGVSRNSVRKYLSKFDASESFANKELADTAYNNDQLEQDAQRLQNLFDYFKDKAADLSKTGVTRQLLWHEYLLDYSDGYGYSQFCYHLQIYHRSRDLSMHLEYKPGDMIMVDFAGKKQHYVDVHTGERIACEVFVAILPFSGLIFCFAVHTQQTADLATCFNEMLRFYGGSPATILCDNLKTAVIRPSKYEPVFTELCNQAGEHYGTTFSATRPYSPKDKAMVERAVNIVYTHIYAPLRNHTFTSLKTLNQAMHQQLLMLNDKPYKNTAHSRWYYYDLKEKASLRPLPSEPFAPKKVVMLTVQRNYHVQLTENYHYYSVPFQHAGKKVKVHYDNRVVEVYLDHERIAVHLRKAHQNAYTTLAEHIHPIINACMKLKDGIKQNF